MRPENRALLTMLVSVIVVLAAGGAVIFLTAHTNLLIPSGTVFSYAMAQTWVVRFNVSATGSRLVGAWTAYNGSGLFSALVVVNGTVERPPVHCPLFPPPGTVPPPWTEHNGSIETPVVPGPHSLYWSACSAASKIIITESVEVV